MKTHMKMKFSWKQKLPLRYYIRFSSTGEKLDKMKKKFQRFAETSSSVLHQVNKLYNNYLNKRIGEKYKTCCITNRFCCKVCNINFLEVAEVAGL